MDVILLGPPGAGKGTQGDILSRKSGMPRVSTGDLLRQAVREGTTLGQKAKSYMDQGLLVPDRIIMGLIEEVLESERAAGGIIMDGFPRTVAQAEAVDEILEKHDRRIDAVLLFEAPAEELVNRMLGRAREQGRSDDTEEAIRKRLEVYRQETEPLVQYYDKRGLVKRVDAMGSIEEIASRVDRALA